MDTNKYGTKWFLVPEKGVRTVTTLRSADFDSPRLSLRHSGKATKQNMDAPGEPEPCPFSDDPDPASLLPVVANGPEKVALLGIGCHT